MTKKLRTFYHFVISLPKLFTQYTFAMKDFQLSFASILKYISVFLIIIGVISMVAGFIMGSSGIFSSAFGEIFFGLLFYALSIIVQAAAIYIKKNTPEPQKPQEEKKAQE